jgi:hypothetical protein
MCDCITKVQKSLVEYNTQVDVCLGIRDNTFKFLDVYLGTHKIDKKKRGQPKNVVASYCPFCGEKYDSAPD